MQFTKEQLIEHAKKHIAHDVWLRNKFGETHNTPATVELARIALASLEAEPVSFDDLRDAVAEVSGGNAMEWSDIYKGHQAVPFINFNSLARIVDKFRTAPSVAQLQEWTNEQCLEFLSIAFRHAEIKGNLELDDIRLGVKMVNGSCTAMQGSSRTNGG
ncbi:TPA: hypothetical protein ACOEHG_004910 [Enterobacter ludwigii]